ncbi:unnamed protein product [Lathyrus oleraceus]
MAHVQKDFVAKRLICNEDKDEGLECNQKDGNGNENDSALNVNFEDSDEDAIGIDEEISIDKGVGRPMKQREVEEIVEGSGSMDDVNEGEVPKESFGGLGDIEEYDSDELPQEYGSED